MQNDQDNKKIDLDDDLMDDMDDSNDLDSNDFDDLDDDDNFDDLSWNEEGFDELDGDDDSEQNLTPQKKRKLSFNAILAGLLIAIVGGGGWLYLSSDQTSTVPQNTTAPKEMAQSPSQENWPTQQTINTPIENTDLPMPAPMLSQIEEEKTVQAEVLTPMPQQNDLSADTQLTSLNTEEAKADVTAGEIFFKPAVQVTPIDDIIADGSFIPQEKKEIAITSLAAPSVTKIAEIEEITAQKETKIIEEQVPQEPAPLLIEAMPVNNSVNITAAASEAQLSDVYEQIEGLEAEISASNTLLAEKISATEGSISDLSSSLSRLEKSLEALIELQSLHPEPVVKEPTKTARPPELIIQKTTKEQAPLRVKKIIEAPVKKPTYTPPKVKKAPSSTRTTPKRSNIWTLRSAQPGAALISEKGSNDYLSIRVGDKIPHIGRVLSIELENNEWIVRASNGVIYQ